MGRKDPVTADVRREVLARDRMCIAYRMDNEHRCRDQWGDAHSPFDVERLTLEHVKEHLTLGRRAPSDPAHLVALCGGTNVGVPSKAMREAFRQYLATLYPAAWADFLGRRSA